LPDLDARRAARARYLRGVQDVLSAVTPDLAARIPAQVARRLVVIPVRHDPSRRTLVVAVADPSDISTIDQLSFATGLRVEVVAAPIDELRRAVARHYPAPLDQQPPPRLARGTSGPPLPKIPSYEQLERTSKKWVAAIVAIGAFAVAMPRMLRWFARERSDERREQREWAHQPCRFMEINGWYRSGPNECVFDRNGDDESFLRVIDADEIAEEAVELGCDTSGECSDEARHAWVWRHDYDSGYRTVVLTATSGVLGDWVVDDIDEQLALDSSP
jgi:hypothetical protein